MKAKDRPAVSALRATIAAIDNAEAVAPTTEQRGQAIEEVSIGAGSTEVARLVLTEEDVIRIVQAEADERETAAAEYHQLGRADRADQLTAEAAVLRAHLAAE